MRLSVFQMVLALCVDIGELPAMPCHKFVVFRAGCGIQSSFSLLESKFAQGIPPLLHATKPLCRNPWRAHIVFIIIPAFAVPARTRFARRDTAIQNEDDKGNKSDYNMDVEKTHYI